MKSKFQSPFKPNYIKDYKPRDINIYTFHAGFKKTKKDLMILHFKNPVPIAAVYSTTSMPSAPIIWDKKNNKGYCKLLIVNSGNANAHTGIDGLKKIEVYVNAACKFFNCKKNEILVSSTGVIGEIIDPYKITKKISNTNLHATEGILAASRSIMTTDSFPKTFISKLRYKSKVFKIYGFAKGSGMISPNMGTMLAYIFIEAPINRSQLKLMLNQNLSSTFNSITVDGDTSTSDTVILFSSKTSKEKIIKDKKIITKISRCLHGVMLNLAKQIVSDGEGISKLIQVHVRKAKSKKQAEKIAFSIAKSILVKTAIAGEDANWGRVVMAIGKSDKNAVQNKIIISFGSLIVAKKGSIYKNINIKKLDQYMKNRKIDINVDLGLGKFDKKVWSSDLTHDYISLNADYRS